jgi:hypothetical protein
VTEQQPDDNDIDLSDFTPEELAMAREFLLARRAAADAEEAEPAIVTTGISLEWKLTDQGGQARRVPWTMTRRGNSLACQPDYSRAGKWFACSGRSGYEPAGEPEADF